MAVPHYFILESDEHNLSLLLYILDSAGSFTYQAFDNTEDLLAALEHEKPTMMFCKVSITGCDVRAICKNRHIQVPIIFLSDLYPGEERRRCFLESQYTYISAPLYPEKILPYLRKEQE